MFTGENLRLLRQVRRIEQKELAQMLGISQQRYSALENSKKVSDSWSEKILDALKFSPNEAMGVLKVIIPPPRSKQPVKVR